MSGRRKQPRTNWLPETVDAAGRWGPVLLRALAVLFVSLPAASKFVKYSDWVGRFDAWGIPLPEVAVPAVALVQVVAILSLTLGIAGRFGATALAVVMVVAMATAGPNAMNAVVLGSSAGIAYLGTGPYSYCDPQFSDLSPSSFSVGLS